MATNPLPRVKKNMLMTMLGIMLSCVALLSQWGTGCNGAKNKWMSLQKISAKEHSSNGTAIEKIALSSRAQPEVLNFTTSPHPECGIMFIVGLTTPKIVVYEERWKALGGRGPYRRELERALISIRKNSPSLPVALASDVGKGNFSSEII
jgi:hypothetical protein